MSRTRDRWGDEDDERPRRLEPKGGLSPVAIVLIAVGGLFLLGLVACGGLMVLGYTRAERAQVEMAEAERAERLRRDEVMNGGIPVLNPPGAEPFAPPDEPPAPKPGFQAAADPPPQPKATDFATDDREHPDRWRVLFRSKKPDLWNTNTQDADDFAIPLRSTPAAVKYLRLRRMDTGEAVIVPMTRARIGRVDPQGPRVRWNGEGKDEYGGCHLGIAEGPVARFTEGKGTIGVLMDGFDANPGSGFGHAHHVEDGGQRYSWMGKEIEPTAFEVAVTTGELTGKEREWLRE